MDSEYFKKEYTKLVSHVKSRRIDFEKFNDLNLKVDASAFYPSLEPHYGTGNFPFLRVADVNTNVDYEKCIRVPLEIINQPNFNTLNIIRKGDIVITKGGSIARVGLIEQETAVTRDLIFINSSILPEISYKFLFLYLLSDISYRLLIRSSSMTAQPHLTIQLVRELPIFKGSEAFKVISADILDKSKVTLKHSKESYKKAEALLLQEIGLENLEPRKEHINIKSFKESFGVTKRLDAEYYQKKYEQIVSKIKTQSHDTLKNIVDISKSVEPGSNHYSEEEGLPFYRVSDYNRFGLSKPDKELTNSFVADNKELIEKLKPKKGTILFSKDGSVGTAYLLRKDLDGITSGAILHLKVKNSKGILPEYLTLVLNSKLVQMQAERDAGGSVILHWGTVA